MVASTRLVVGGEAATEVPMMRCRQSATMGASLTRAVLVLRRHLRWNHQR